MGPALYLGSVILALALCRRAAGLVEGGTRQLLAAVAALTLPWGLIANGLSAGHWLTPGGWLAAQAALTAAGLWAARRWGWPDHAFERPRGWRRREVALAVAAAAVVGTLLILQMAQPVWVGDDIRYHASRVLYWIGQRSVFPFPTHNDRQTVFGYQGELAFLWPVLFTQAEWVGRAVYWLAVPLAAALVHALARKAGADRAGALLATLWFLCVPIVLRHGYGLKPEMWLTFYFLGALWCLLDGMESDGWGSFAMAGLYLALAIHTKLSAAAVLPALAGAAWLSRGARGVTALAGGAAAGAGASGLGLLLLFNTLDTGHPLGPAGMREVHSAPLSARQVRTHLARTPLLLAELPAMPFAPVRAAMERAGAGWLRALDADTPLPLEQREGWPGLFVFEQPVAARNFSLGGVLLLFVLAVGARRGQPGRTAVWAATLSLLLAVVLAVRWMTHSTLPERFLLPCYAAGMALAPVCLPRRLRLPVLVAGLAVTALIPLVVVAREARRMLAAPPGEEEVAGPFAEAMARIPGGSRILFFGSQDAPDYGLFGPGAGYDRGVVAWGKRPFDRASLERVVSGERITHILFQDERSSYFHWAPSLGLAPFVSWARERAGSRDVSLETPHMVLVALPGAAAASPTTALMAAPATRPLVLVDRMWQGRVGVEPGLLRTPWAVEDLGSEEKGFLWLGTGEEEGLHFSLWAARAERVTLALRAGPGPSRTGPERTLAVRVGTAAAQTAQLAGEGEVRFDVELAAGSNRVAVFAVDAATVGRLANGDTRRLIAGLREVRVEGPNPALKAGSVQAAWAMENLGAPEPAFLWLGSGAGVERTVAVEEGR